MSCEGKTVGRHLSETVNTSRGCRRFDVSGSPAWTGLSVPTSGRRTTWEGSPQSGQGCRYRHVGVVRPGKAPPPRVARVVGTDIWTSYDLGVVGTDIWTSYDLGVVGTDIAPSTAAGEWPADTIVGSHGR